MFRKTPSPSKATVSEAVLFLLFVCGAQALFTEDYQRFAAHVQRSTRNEESSLHSNEGRANHYEIRKVGWDDSAVSRDAQRKSSELKKVLKKEEEDERQTTLPEHWKFGKLEATLGNAKMAYQKIPWDDAVEFIKEAPVRLPDTSGIPGQLTEKLGVERFFSLWMVFNNVESAPALHGDAFVILAPVDKNALLESPVPPLEQLLAKPHILRNLLLSHILVGKPALSLIKQKIILPDGSRDDITDEDGKFGGNFTTLSGKILNLQWRNGSLWANDKIRVQIPGHPVPKGGIVLLLDKYLFLDDVNDQLRSSMSKPYKSSPLISSYEPFNDKENASGKYELKAEADFEERKDFINGETFLHFLNNSLSKIPTAEAFRRLLAVANISNYFCSGENYTVIVPPNEAFRSWEPIDYGFRPFSVQEFISVIIRNHVIRGSIHLTSLKDGDILETLDGGHLYFKDQDGKSPSINGVNLYTGPNSDITIPGGNILLLHGFKVLFVDEDVVRRLRRLHPEAESGPPILVDWTGSTFLAYVSINLHERSHVSEDRMMDDFLPEPVEVNSDGDSPFLNTSISKDERETLTNATLEIQTITPTTPVPNLCNPLLDDLVCIPDPSLSTVKPQFTTPEYCMMEKVQANVSKEDYHSFDHERWNGGNPGRDWVDLFSRDDNKPRMHVSINNETREDSFNHMLRIIHEAGGHIESREPEGYTIFVPTDYGLEWANFPEEGPLRDAWALSILYNHMVVGRVVDKQLKVGSKFVTLGNKTITVCKDEGSLWLNRARIIESNIFIYDLGAMVIVDGPIFPLPFLDENSKWAYNVCE